MDGDYEPVASVPGSVNRGHLENLISETRNKERKYIPANCPHNLFTQNFL